MFNQTTHHPHLRKNHQEKFRASLGRPPHPAGRPRAPRHPFRAKDLTLNVGDSFPERHEAECVILAMAEVHGYKPKPIINVS